MSLNRKRTTRDQRARRIQRLIAEGRVSRQRGVGALVSGGSRRSAALARAMAARIGAVLSRLTGRGPDRDRAAAAAWQRGYARFQRESRARRRPDCAFCARGRAWLAASLAALRALPRGLAGAAAGLVRWVLAARLRPSAPLDALRALRRAWTAGLARWREGGGAGAPSGSPLRRDGERLFLARSYHGSRNRSYMLRLPQGHSDGEPRPLVVVLHGCRQDNRDIRQISGFDALADRHRFILLYPFVTSYAGLRHRNCWGWWFEREIHAGAGEVEDLWQLVREVKAEHAVDRHRIHVAGLSSGAGMAVALMVARARKIASGAAVAGVPYAETARAVAGGRAAHARYRPVADIAAAMQAEMGARKRLVPLFIGHSRNDLVVNIQAARNLRDSWAHCFQIDTRKRVASERGTTRGVYWEHTRYRDLDRRSLIETLFLDGPGHGWYGGLPGRFSYPEAPDVARWIWRFFHEHPMERKVAETGMFEPGPGSPVTEALRAGGG